MECLCLGELPDGEYGYNTKIRYCCRTDGNPEKSIDLPRTKPFYLLKKGRMCQKVCCNYIKQQYCKQLTLGSP